MPNITNIPPQRVPFIDERTGLISREWYRFLLNLFQIAGSGTSDTSVVDLQLVPQAQVDFGDLNDLYTQAALSYVPNVGDLNNLYDQAQLSYQSAVIGELQSDIDALKVAPKPLEIHPIPYGSFFDTTTQTGSTTTGTTITFNSTDVSKGVYVGATTSRIYVTEAGYYNFQFSLQIENSISTQGDINIWFRINGVDITGSNGYVWVPGKHAGADGHIIIGWNFFITLAANDYVELVWVPSATTMTIKNYAAIVGPPAIPSTYSAVLTAFKVNITTG
jgi:hypothetical protein